MSLVRPSAIDAACFAAGDRQIFSSALWPFLPIADRPFLQMQDREARPDQGAGGFVKGDQHGWWIVTGTLAITPEQDMADHRGAQPFALRGEKGEFGDRVEPPQVGAEFEAVDDQRRWSERDMFRAQVAMPLDNPAPPRAQPQWRGNA
jgi:hypothetical protein